MNDESMLLEMQMLIRLGLLMSLVGTWFGFFLLGYGTAIQRRKHNSAIVETKTDSPQ